ncbi:hypothetical protein Q8A73_024358 [Channa argus]|nr:hypothetical protein Q8A73_024358 [Channa argus]
MYSEGRWKGRDVALGGLSACQGLIKILGVQFKPMNSSTVNWEGRFQRVKSRLALWKARKLTLLGKVLVLKADMLSSVLHLAYVFPLPVAIRRPLARTIFDFQRGGRYEWVALGRMMSGLAEGGRDVPDLPLKLDTIFVASLLQDMASEVGHPAGIGMKYLFLYAARGILNWSNVGPRSEQLPWHYAWVAKLLRAHPEALEDGIWKQQRVLYRVVRGKVNPSPVLGVPSSVWVGVQAVGLSNEQKDLNWACLHRTLPVRDKIHRHGLGRSPLCPRPSCGAGETAYHVMWECSFTSQLWAKAKKVVGRAKPDLTLTWQVVERGFVGAHIRSRWGILWLLLSLYKRGLWLVIQELVRNGVEWRFLDRLSTVPGSAASRCSRFCCTQMLMVLKGLGTPPAFPCRGHQSRRQCESDPGSRGRGPTGMKYFFLYAARGILNWSNVGPRSEQLPWHYAWVAKWLRAHPEALEDGIWKQQRVLYRVVRGKVNPSPVLGVPSSVWVGVQAVGLSNGLKDLNWACLHRTLPVRDTIHRHGVGRSPLCPRPSCGAGETAYHVMWECSFARQLWAKAKKVVGRAKPDLTLTWQVVERSFVGAHIRSGWGILWLLLSLYKRGPWLVRQELVRSGVEWSTERVAKGVESEVTERIKWEVDKLGYHAAKEKWKGGFGLL